nr:beta-1,6-N-acetylglucosaminyltransferase [Pseudomonas sp. Fl4BN1]
MTSADWLASNEYKPNIKFWFFERTHEENTGNHLPPSNKPTNTYGKLLFITPRQHHINSYRQEIHDSGPRILNKENVVLIEDRANVKWGGASQIEATTNLMTASRKYHYDYLFLLSGDDTFIQIDNYSNDLLKSNTDYKFIHYQNKKPPTSTRTYG